MKFLRVAYKFVLCLSWYTKYVSTIDMKQVYTIFIQFWKSYIMCLDIFLNMHISTMYMLCLWCRISC